MTSNHFNAASIAPFHAITPVSFPSFATLAFANPKAKKHASPAVNGRRLLPSFFGHLQPPPLLRSQAARPTATKLHSVPPFRFSALPTQLKAVLPAWNFSFRTLRKMSILVY